jgi:hypothetical protein
MTSQQKADAILRKRQEFRELLDDVLELGRLWETSTFASEMKREDYLAARKRLEKLVLDLVVSHVN